jgi:uncharacterized protein
MTLVPRVRITTYSGICFDLEQPTADMVSLDDIAHHLSQVCRWAGATSDFYSVAQHSVLVSYITPLPLQQWGLLHDAAEAYIGDITRPLKTLLPHVHEIEDRIMRVVCEKFHLPYPEPPELGMYDDQIQRYEAETIMRRHDGKFIDRTGDACEVARLTIFQRRQIPPRIFGPMNPPAAEILFALRFSELFHTKMPDHL